MWGIKWDKVKVIVDNTSKTEQGPAGVQKLKRRKKKAEILESLSNYAHDSLIG